MLNDLLLFKKIKDGDIKAFETIFRRYHLPLCIYASSITGRADIAPDVVQDIFYIIWKERATIRIRSSVGNYLYGAVKNRSLQYLERMRVHERYVEYVSNKPEPAAPSPQEQLEYKELETAVDTTLARLPERRLLIFRMHRMQGLKYAEIAEKLSISVKTVEAEMTKAYRHIRQEIKNIANK